MIEFVILKFHGKRESLPCGLEMEFYNMGIRAVACNASKKQSFVPMFDLFFITINLLLKPGKQHKRNLKNLKDLNHKLYKEKKE